MRAAGFYERNPLNSRSMRTVYHVRRFDIEKLKQLGTNVDMVLSHDWPVGIVESEYDQQRLLRKKPYFKQDLATGNLGNPETKELIDILHP